MRFTAKRFERFFQRIERGSWIGQHLFTFADDVQLIKTQGADNDNLAVVIITARRRSFGQAGVSGLHQDNFIRGDAGAQNAPQF